MGRVSDCSLSLREAKGGIQDRDLEAGTEAETMGPLKDAGSLLVSAVKSVPRKKVSTSSAGMANCAV